MLLGERKMCEKRRRQMARIEERKNELWDEEREEGCEERLWKKDRNERILLLQLISCKQIVSQNRLNVRRTHAEFVAIACRQNFLHSKYTLLHTATEAEEREAAQFAGDSEGSRFLPQHHLTKPDAQEIMDCGSQHKAAATMAQAQAITNARTHTQKSKRAATSFRPSVLTSLPAGKTFLHSLKKYTRIGPRTAKERVRPTSR